jgi:hypothetical protein
MSHQHNGNPTVKIFLFANMAGLLSKIGVQHTRPESLRIETLNSTPKEG